MNGREDPLNFGSCSLPRYVRPLWSPALNTLGDLVTGSSAEVDGRDSRGEKPWGLDHFPGAGASRGCTKVVDGLSPNPRLRGKEVRGFCLSGASLFRLSVLTSGFCGLAHLEIGGAHFPIPAGVDVVSGDGGAVGLLSRILHPPGRALTCTTQRVSV